MANRIFKKETSFFGKLEAFYWRMWEKEWFRFLVVGALNTVVGLVVTFLLRFLFDAVWAANPKWDIAWWIFHFNIDLPYLIMFVLLFAYSYTTQALWVFRTKWSWRRCLIYPLSSIPNLLLQQIFIYLFEVVLHLDPYLSYVLASICPIPVMYVVNRFLVKPKEKKEIPTK